MEKLERPAHPFPPGRLSPTKYISGAEPLCGPGSKRDSGFSCFSIASSPPIHDHRSPDGKGTSNENIFFKGLHSEGPQQAEWPRYLQPTMGNGGREEQSASRVSVAGRPGVGPMWQVPEKKKSQSPPPQPPLRCDSFAATKVFPYSEGPGGPAKTHGRSVEKLTESNLRSQQEKTSEARRCFNSLSTTDFLLPNTAADHNHNQLHPNKLFSLSSNDVRQSHYTQRPAHQRQYSDESPFCMQTRSAPPTKIQSVGSYYRSLQELPTNIFSRKHARHSTASMASSAANPNQENGGHNRYYGPASKRSVQTAQLQVRHGKVEGRRGEMEKPQQVNSNEPGFTSSLKTNGKTKYSLPQSQLPYSDNKERSGHSNLGNGLHYDRQASELSVRSQEDAAKRCEGHAYDTKRHVATHQCNDHKVGLSRHQDPWVPQEDHRISPLKTPLLHSLAQESRSLAARQPAAMTAGATQDAGDTAAGGGGKSYRRSDRYATTLRNEIQQKRAQLQKSRSAATLTCNEEDEEWRSTNTSMSSGASFSNTYKDHLKEAQARVLQATSFQRRDLEPLGPEVPVVKRSSGRIRGRKRFPMAKRVHSFSEPDTINKVGVEGEPQTGSFGERKKFFEAKPAFSRPVLKSSANLNADLGETVKPKEMSPSAEEEARPPAEHLSPGHKQVLAEQQRLGTFAEYQATWNQQKKSSEAKTQGRCHSAENILDADVEEKAVCVHERSRSSPSADFYTQVRPKNIPFPWRDPLSQQSTDRGKAESRLRCHPDHRPQPAPSDPRNEGPVPGLTDHRPRPDAASPYHTTHSSGPGSQYPSQLPQTKGLLPPPRPHLGPETTSSLAFLTGAQADLTALEPLSRHHSPAQTSSAGPASAGSARPGAGRSRGGGGTEPEKEPPSSLLGARAAAPSLPATERAPSPSPQSAPPRLTDRPPAARDDSPLSSENGLRVPAEMEVNHTVRKVPVRIVHAECSSHREGRAYLPQSGETCSASEPPVHVPPLSPASSLFSAYARQDPAQASGLLKESSPARRSEEDAKREELARDIMGKDKSLVDILDQSGRMTTMDLMEGLFPTEEQVLEGNHQRRRASSGSRLPTSSPRSMDRREEEDSSASASLVPSSSYYNTSAPKAELLIKMKDMQEQLEEQDSEDELEVDLARKKQELISSLARKLEVLREARRLLQEDVEDNEALGREVEATARRRCRPNQLDKFCMFVGDLDKVVSLLLSLSGRLARVENALDGLEEEAEEKRTLTEKRKLLMRQHEDAKELKENLDRRERLVYGIMEAHLDAGSLDDYRHFVKMKSALIIEQRKLEDKVKLGEEQLKCLLDSLPPEQRPAV
ncbi:protein Shroom2-like isoform X1 [Cyclopterus lumpus]|uniref:protein Shroom2-like isoform X1 n=1 Tax=Cyclopterus lumpus TaxID=8103 RepID=UPI001486D19E|nr:protein Shroom2-like isoform X1 [Cyclopterus lumpus]XP_034404575.1 protein Shroom2-like isoform X1 [Cyclopterus lumpus]